METLWHWSALTHRLFTRICRPFYSTSISCGNLNDTLTIIYFSLKGPWSQKGLSEHHENWFWILLRKIRANIKILTKIPDFMLFLPNQKLLNKKFLEDSKTLSQINMTKHPYFGIYLNFKILQSLRTWKVTQLWNPAILCNCSLMKITPHLINPLRGQGGGRKKRKKPPLTKAWNDSQPNRWHLSKYA